MYVVPGINQRDVDKIDTREKIETFLSHNQNIGKFFVIFFAFYNGFKLSNGYFYFFVEAKEFAGIDIICCRYFNVFLILQTLFTQLYNYVASIRLVAWFIKDREKAYQKVIQFKSIMEELEFEIVHDDSDFDE